MISTEHNTINMSKCYRCDSYAEDAEIFGCQNCQKEMEKDMYIIQVLHGLEVLDEIGPEMLKNRKATLRIIANKAKQILTKTEEYSSAPKEQKEERKI